MVPKNENGHRKVKKGPPELFHVPKESALNFRSNHEKNEAKLMERKPSGGGSKVDGKCRQHATVKKHAKMGSSRPNSGYEKATNRSAANRRYEYVPRMCDSVKKRPIGDQ
jgi:hypothetical protein